MRSIHFGNVIIIKAAAAVVLIFLVALVAVTPIVSFVVTVAENDGNLVSV